MEVIILFYFILNILLFFLIEIQIITNRYINNNKFKELNKENVKLHNKIIEIKKYQIKNERNERRRQI